MKYITILLLIAGLGVKGQAINSQQRNATIAYCPASPDHKHHFGIEGEKCNFYGCGWLCDCGAKKFYKSGIIVLSYNNTANQYWANYRADSIAYSRMKNKKPR